MDYNRNIVVVGGEDNSSKLFAQLEPIRLSHNKGLAIKSIFYGTVFNINKHNNHVHYQIPPLGERIVDVSDNNQIAHNFKIPEGNYPSVYSILNTISDKIVEIYPDDGSRLPLPRFELFEIKKKGVIKISVKGLQKKF